MQGGYIRRTELPLMLTGNRTKTYSYQTKSPSYLARQAKKAVKCIDHFLYLLNHA